MLTAELLGIKNMREVIDTFWDYRANWKMIGMELNIDTGTLDCIYEDNRKCERCLYELIKLWLQSTTAKASAISAVLQSKFITSEISSTTGK